MSKKFNIIKKYYDEGYWNKKMVADAVRMGRITAEEYKVITSEEYTEE